MPEATILYTVTAVVVAGLAGWVFAVLRTAKEPWKRAAPASASAAAGEPEEPSASTDDRKDESPEEGTRRGEEEKG